VFRAWFALPETLRDARGNPASAVYGFTSFLLRFLAEEQPTHLATCFDESLNTSFRNDLYPRYKETRELPPPELEAQLAACQEVAAALGGAVFSDARYEADDLVGTLAAQLRAQGQRAVVVSSDKDLTQLVDDDVSFFDFAKGERLGAVEVQARFGVRPAQIPDFLGLAGDSVDNIPGVPRVGAKTAAGLLAHFDDLDALYADLERVADVPLRGASTLGKKLAEHRELAFLSRELATIAVDAPAVAELEALRVRRPDPRVIDPLFERLGFGTLRARIRTMTT
jgi:5'-3' exonuclease